MQHCGIIQITISYQFIYNHPVDIVMTVYPSLTSSSFPSLHPWCWKRSPRQRRGASTATADDFNERVNVGRQYHCASYKAELHDCWRLYNQPFGDDAVVWQRLQNIPLLVSSDPLISSNCSSADIFFVKMAEHYAVYMRALACCS